VPTIRMRSIDNRTKRGVMKNGLVVLWAAVALLALSGLAGAAANGPSTLTFSDPAGDATGAPDVTKVSVNGDAATGTITFALTATGLALPSSDGSQREVDLWLNTDRNDSTGSPSGNEYNLFVWTDSTDATQWYWDIYRYANGNWEEVAATPTMHVSSIGNDFTLQFNKSDLGVASSFDVYATSSTFDANGNNLAHDVAPDVGAWVYDINGPSKTLITFLKPAIGKPVLQPARAAAGKRLTVSMPVTANPLGKPSAPLASGKIVGTVTVGGKPVAHTTSLNGGVAKVSLLLPRTAKGKTAKVTVTVTAPSSEGDSGTWVDLATGELGVQATVVKGASATKTVSTTIH
jgi:hypothetical protein